MPAFIHANGQRQPSSGEICAPPEIYGKQLNFADVSVRPQRALAVILLKTQGKRWANRFLPPLKYLLMQLGGGSPIGWAVGEARKALQLGGGFLYTADW